MSIYGYLFCHDCEQMLWLGKALRDDNGQLAYQIGTSPPNWKNEVLNQVVWKFLADHTMHKIDARLEHQATDQMHEYKEIGGDEIPDISFSEYLSGWIGLDLDDE
jgi:hypothetical protein